jgi:hypothetical protein
VVTVVEQDVLFDMERTPLLEIPEPRPQLSRRRPDPPGWGEVTAAVFDRDGWVCQRCFRLCRRDGKVTPRMATCDHVVPLALGGWDDPVNLQTLCLRCNQFKGERIIDYRGDVALRVALELARDERELVAGMPRGGIAKGSEKLSEVMTARVTETEAAALLGRYGTKSAALRAALDRLLYTA